jgi:hypothetical protein
MVIEWMEIADFDDWTISTCFHRLGPAGPTVGSHLSEPTINNIKPNVI